MATTESYAEQQLSKAAIWAQRLAVLRDESAAELSDHQAQVHTAEVRKAYWEGIVHLERMAAQPVDVVKMHDDACEAPPSQVQAGQAAAPRRIRVVLADLWHEASVFVDGKGLDGVLAASYSVGPCEQGGSGISTVTLVLEALAVDVDVLQVQT